MGLREKAKNAIHGFTHNPSFTVKEQLGYAGGMFGNAMGQDCVYTYSSKFSRDFQMIDVGRLNWLENISTALSFLIPPVAGSLLDRPTPVNKKSAAKWILQLMPLPFAMFSLLLFVVPSGSVVFNMIWTFVLTILFYVVDSFYDIAMETISLRMTTNPGDRKNFYTIASLAASLGSMLPGWILPIIVGKFAAANEQKWAHFYVALVFCVLGVTTMCAPYFTLNEKVGMTTAHNKKEEKVHWDRKTVSAVLHNKPFIIAMIAMVCETVRQVTYDLLPDLYRETFDNYGMKPIIDALSGALSYVGLFSVPFVGAKISARTMLVGSHLYSALFYSLMALFGLRFDLTRIRKWRYLPGVLIGFSGMPNAGMSAARQILVADSTDYMEWYTEKKYGAPLRSDGMMMAIRSITGKINTLIRVNIKNLSLKGIGYQSGRQDAAGKAIRVVQSDRTLRGIYFVVALCGVIGNVLPALVYSFDRFTGKYRTDILRELSEMRAVRNEAETLIAE